MIPRLLSIFIFFSSCPFLIDWPGMPPFSGWDITQPSAGINWNYPPGNWNILVKFLSRREPLLCTHRRVEEASLAAPLPGLK